MTDRNKCNQFSELPLFLTVPELAKLLSLSRNTTYDLVHRVGFPMVKIGKRILVPRDAFWEWITHQEEGRAGKKLIACASSGRKGDTYV